MDGGGGGGYSPRFQRQASCSCAPSISRRGFVRAGFDLDGDDYYYDDDIFPSSSSSSSGGGAAYDKAYGAPRPSARARLRGLWRRIKREKKRILLCTTGCVPAAAPPHREPYDAYSYAQNFDDGEAWVEPENLSRSFSARFAVPSRVFQRVAVPSRVFQQTAGGLDFPPFVFANFGAVNCEKERQRSHL